VEYHLLDDVDLQADFLTGSSALGYFSIGAVFSLDQNISVLTAFQRANAADSGSVIRTAVRYQF
jgi:hypothetical protein